MNLDADDKELPTRSSEASGSPVGGDKRELAVLGMGRRRSFRKDRRLNSRPPKVSLISISQGSSCELPC